MLWTSLVRKWGALLGLEYVVAGCSLGVWYRRTFDVAHAFRAMTTEAVRMCSGSAVGVVKFLWQEAVTTMHMPCGMLWSKVGSTCPGGCPPVSRGLMFCSQGLHNRKLQQHSSRRNGRPRSRLGCLSLSLISLCTFGAETLSWSATTTTPFRGRQQYK